MNKILKFLPIILFTAPALAGCNKSKDNIVIRVLNSADYIYEAEKNEYYCDECGDYVARSSVQESYDEELDQTTYISTDCGHEVYLDMNMTASFEEYMNEKYPGKKFTCVYDTFDTPETCYNQLKTGKSNYDVINVSDYMIQKLITNKLVQPLFDGEDEHTSEIEDSLHEYLSPFLWGEESSIFNTIHPKKENSNEYDEEKLLADYAVPYMWGTVGIMFNSTFYKEKFNEEECVEYFNSWESIYDPLIKNSFFIKDSVRDTYAVSVLHVYKDEIEALKEQYHIGEIDADNEAFNRELTVIFNRCDNQTLSLIKDDMNKLKENAYGFEVDSGKTDMVAGEKVGSDLAWSGDATWAIYEAATTVARHVGDENYDESNKTKLHFMCPDEGSNIWTDAWAIPTVAKYKDYALDFIEFMTQPENAVANMDYVGYTTATSGDEVLAYIREMYDVREYEDDFPDEEYMEYDISYFFEDCLEEYDIEDAILHVWSSDTEATFEVAEDKITKEVSYSVYNRMIYAQFPESDMLPKLAIMDDYGNRNDAVLEMWQTIRTNPLPLWAIILLACEILAVIAAITLTVTSKVKHQKLRQERVN